MSFFPSFAPLASVPHSFFTYCSLNGRPGAIKAKLHLGSLECLSRLDPLRSSSNMKYSLARREKRSKHKSNTKACWTFQSTWVNSMFQGVFWQTRQQLSPEATAGKVWIGKVWSQPDTEVFYLRRGITSTPILGQLSLVWKKFTSADNGSFPWQWPQHLITTP